MSHIEDHVDKSVDELKAAVGKGDHSPQELLEIRRFERSRDNRVTFLRWLNSQYEDALAEAEAAATENAVNTAADKPVGDQTAGGQAPPDSASERDPFGAERYYDDHEVPRPSEVPDVRVTAQSPGAHGGHYFDQAGDHQVVPRNRPVDAAIARGDLVASDPDEEVL